MSVHWGRPARGHTYGPHHEAEFREARRREAEKALMVPDEDLHRVDCFLSWGYAVALAVALVALGLVMLVMA